MLKRLLPFAVVIETEFIHCAVANSEGVSNVPLLKAFRDNVSEPGEIRAGEFKVGERVQRSVVIEIVIDAQVLFIIDPVVNLDRKLVPAYRLGGNGTDQRTVVRGRRDALKEINCRRVHTGKRDLTVGEDGRKRVPRD